MQPSFLKTFSKDYRVYQGNFPIFLGDIVDCNIVSTQSSNVLASANLPFPDELPPIADCVVPIFTKIFKNVNGSIDLSDPELRLTTTTQDTSRFPDIERLRPIWFIYPTDEIFPRTILSGSMNYDTYTFDDIPESYDFSYSNTGASLGRLNFLKLAYTDFTFMVGNLCQLAAFGGDVPPISCVDGFDSFLDSGIYYSGIEKNSGGTGGYCSPPAYPLSYYGDSFASNKKYLTRVVREYKDEDITVNGEPAHVTFDLTRLETYGGSFFDVDPYTIENAFGRFVMEYEAAAYNANIRWDLTLDFSLSAWVGSYTQESTISQYNFTDNNLVWPIGSTYCSGSQLLHPYGYGINSNQSPYIVPPIGKTSLWGFNADGDVNQNQIIDVVLSDQCIPI